jgi:hypothetical protein
MSLTRDLARLHSDSDGNLILANNLTVDTNTLKVDAANNRVGINHTAPLKSLHVNEAGDAGIMLTTSNAATGYRNWEMQVGADGSNHANFIVRTRADNGTGGDEILRMTKEGNIGLGTSTPNNYTNWKTLTFNGTGTSGGEIDFETQGTLNADIFAGPNNMQIRHLQPTKPIKMYAGGDTAAYESVRLQDGTVMHPNMPYFATRPAYVNSYLANGTVVQFHTPHVNQGNDFNASNHRFTAPFSGAYYFAFHSNIHKAAAGVVSFDWWKNGSSVMGTQGGRIYGYYQGGWENMMGFCVLNLAANDYVTFNASGGSPKIDGGTYGQYVGYMLNTT